MKIALCTDNRYAMPCGVCIASIFENNKREKLEIVILTNGLKETERRNFEILAEKYERRVQIITVKDEMFARLTVSDRFPISIYYRFLLPQILNTEDKVLYLDCDIIVNQSLEKLWDVEIGEYACAAVENQSSDDIRNQNRIGIFSTYLNSGVLLMNLNYWRTHHISEKLAQYMGEHLNNWYPDQDALNAILYEKVLFLPYTYNFQDLWYGNKADLFIHRSKWDDIEKYKNNPVIIHFCNKVKPWHLECVHPLKTIFERYKEKTPWKDYPLKHAFPLKYRMINFLKKLLKS